ncbi:MAG: AraC family transcriptional regulator [Ruminococcaceae bacterium]|nr:AraC family transcriptional regulator [Oscillospiraceae bacterium]
MNVRNFVLSFYANAADGIHIQRLEKPREAKEFHTHVYFQIYYIKKGSLTHFVENYSSKLSAGDMFIIPPGVVHRIEDDEGISFYSLSFMPEIIEEMSHVASFAANFLKQISSMGHIRPKITVPADEVLRIETLIEQIYDEFQKNNLAGGEIVKIYTALLISLFARIYFDSSNELPLPKSEDKNRLMLYCIDYIKLNYFKNLTLEDMLRLSALSKGEFCRRFREMTGDSFLSYLNRCRIRKACERINNGDKITSVYSFCGYDDYSAFYRNFVKVMGISPAQYKHNAGKSDVI